MFFPHPALLPQTPVPCTHLALWTSPALFTCVGTPIHLCVIHQGRILQNIYRSCSSCLKNLRTESPALDTLMSMCTTSRGNTTPYC